eukprot:TRINITY_DN6985_c0_g1_i1.p1 TRINITY_DN6985_c0_g1~~TRINITY_DN6985_c0_g1_i1.p1  ORF type:complete len:1854 (+),score=413.99 TRINITY_DN6985_c0_g1_i1:282-5564(+)
MSDTLNLNESICAEIISLCLEDSKKSKKPLVEHSIRYYTTQRMYFRGCLDLLFSVLNNDDLPLDDIRELVIQFVFQLLRENLVQSVIEYIKNLLDLSRFDGDTIEWRSAERMASVELLFRIFLTTKMSREDLVQVTDLLHKASLSYSKLRTPFLTEYVDDKKRVMERAMYTTCSILTMVVTIGLDCSPERAEVPFAWAPQGRHIMERTEDILFIKDMDELIRREGWNSEFQSIVTLAWCFYRIFMKGSDNPDTQIDALYELAKEKGVWKALRCMILHWLHDNTSILPTLFLVMDSFFSSFLSLMGKKVGDMKREEYRLPSRNLETSSTFSDLIKFVTLLYKNKPELTEKFWLTPSHHSRFIHVVGESLYHHLFLPYLKMFAVISGSPLSAPYANRYLLSSHSMSFTWENFFSILKRYSKEQGYSTVVQVQKGPLYFPEKVDFLERGYSGQWDHSDFHVGAQKQKATGTQEVLKEQNIIAILRIIKGIVANDANARNLVVSHTTWDVLNSLFTILRSPVLPALKAQILDVLRGLSVGTENVTLIWNLLEKVEMVSTKRAGIRVELEELETNDEKYPLTEAFLDLFNTLISFHIPKELGIASREPGITPYLDFVVKDVFGHFNSRPYRKEEYKWRIAEKATSIFLRLLQDYEVTKEDFQDPKTPPFREPNVSKLGATAKPPGYTLMTLFLTPSELLQRVIEIIQDGVDHWGVDRKPQGEHRAQMLATVANVLQIILVVLKKQAKFIDYQLSSLYPLMLTPLHDLLFDSSSLVPIAKYITADEDHIRLYSIKILNQLSKEYVNPKRMIYMLVVSGCQQLMVEWYGSCLDEIPSIIPYLDGTQDPGIYTSDNSLHMAILQLLEENLQYTYPSLTHFLLNMDCSVDSLPNSMEFGDTNPLEVIVSKLESSIFAQESPMIAEQFHKFVYGLCKNPTTSQVAFLLLRTRSHPFFLLQVNNLSVEIPPVNMAEHFNWRAWLMKTLAKEIFETSVEKQTYTQKLLDALFVTGREVGVDSYEFSKYTHDIGEEHRMIMITLLDFLDLKNLPENDIILKNETYPGCIITDGELEQIDIPLYYSYLRNEQKKKNIPPEKVESFITTQMNLAHSINRQKRLLFSTKHFLDGWKQLLSVTMKSFYVLLPEHAREAILYRLSDALLSKLNSGKAYDQKVLVAFASAFMIVMNQLQDLKVHQITFVVHDTQIQEVYQKFLPVRQLHNIFAVLVQVVMNPKVGNQARTFLYGALSKYFTITQKPISMDPREFEIVHAEKEDQWKRVEFGNHGILERGGDKLIAIVAKDAFLTIKEDNNSCLVVSTAFALLGLIMHFNPQKFFNVLTSTGYLRNYLDSIVNEDFGRVFREMLNSNNLCDYVTVYHSKLSMLNRVASNVEGAACLMDFNVIQILDKCPLLTRRPEDQGIEAYYDSLCEPILRLITSLLLSLPFHQELIFNVAVFISKHSELFLSILRDQTQGNINSLRQLKVTTTLFCLLTKNIRSIPEDKANELHNRFHEPLLLLLSKYSVTEKWQLRFGFNEGKLPVNIKSDIENFVNIIISNILEYAYLISYPHGTVRTRQFNIERVIFSSSLSYSPPTKKPRHEINFFGTFQFAIGTQIPPISLLIYLLGQTVTKALGVINRDQEIKKRINERNNHSEKDFEDILGGTLNNVPRVISNNIELKKHLYYSLEMMLLLLYGHFMLFLEKKKDVVDGSLIGFTPMSSKERESFKREAAALLITDPPLIFEKLTNLPKLDGSDIISVLVNNLQSLLTTE